MNSRQNGKLVKLLRPKKRGKVVWQTLERKKEMQWLHARKTMTMTTLSEITVAMLKKAILALVTINE